MADYRCGKVATAYRKVTHFSKASKGVTIQIGTLRLCYLAFPSMFFSFSKCISMA